MIERYGWTLLFHECIVEQMQKLAAAVDRAKLHDPQGFEVNANVKLFRALTQVMLKAVPGDPNRDATGRATLWDRRFGIGAGRSSDSASACSSASTQK